MNIHKKLDIILITPAHDAHDTKSRSRLAGIEKPRTVLVAANTFQSFGELDESG